MAVTLATFNTKDLLDRDDAQRAILPAKLENLASVLRKLDADVLGLQEVGSAALLEALCAKLDSRGGGNAPRYTSAPYGPPIMGTTDKRGIGNAILTRLPVLASQVHAPPTLPFPVFQAGDPQPFGERIPMRRGVVHARIGTSLGPMDVLVAHFKSNRGLLERDATGRLPAWSDALSSRQRAEAELRSLVWRTSEALFVRGLVDELFAKSPEKLIAVVGDLNAPPGSLVVRIVMGDPTERGRADALASTTYDVAEGARYSILCQGRRELFDHVLVSQTLMERRSQTRICNEDLRDHTTLGAVSGPPAGGPTEVLTTDSDHAPIVVRFE